MGDFGWFFLFVGVVGFFILFQRQSSIRSRTDKFEVSLSRFLLRMERLEGRIQPLAKPSDTSDAVSGVEEPTPSSEETAPLGTEHPHVEVPAESLSEDAGRMEETRPAEPPPLPVEHGTFTAPTPIAASKVVTDEELIPAGPDFGERVMGWIKKLGPSDPNMTIEQAIWTFWIPRFGGLLMTIAVVLGLAYISPGMSEGARVAMGYGVAIGLFGLAFWTNRRYASYAQVVFGFAFATSYIVTFGTHFIPFSKLFETPWPTLLGLAAVVAAWIGWAQYRKSQTIALIATTVGQFTIALAIRSVDDPGFYTIGGLVALGLGSAFFLWRNGWVAPAFLGLVATYANHFYLLLNIEGDATVTQFTIGMSILAAYFLTYAAAAWGFRKESGPLWLRSVFVTLNSAGLFILGSLFMSEFDFTEDMHHVFRYAAGAALLAFAVVYWRMRPGHRLHHIFFTKAIALATYGISYQFDGETLSAFLALEIVILLISSWRSRLPILQCLAYILALTAFGHGIWSARHVGVGGWGPISYPAAVFSTVIIVGSFWIAAIVHERIQWNALWKENTLDGALRIFNRPFSDALRHKIAWAYAFAGVILLELFGQRVMSLENRAILLLGIGSALTLITVWLRSPSIGRAALVVASLGMYWSMRHAMPATYLSMDNAMFTETLIRVGVTTALLLFIIEFVRKHRDTRLDVLINLFPTLGFCDITQNNPTFSKQRTDGPDVTISNILLAVGMATITIPWMEALTPSGYVAIGLLGSATALWLAARVLGSWPIAAAAFIPYSAGVYFGISEFTRNPPMAGALPALGLLAALYAATHPLATREKIGWRLFETNWVPPLFVAALTLLGGLYATYELDPGWRTVALAIASVAGLAVGLRFRAKVTACAAVVALFWSLALWHWDAFSSLDTDWRLGAGAAVLIAAVIIERIGGVRIHKALHGAGTFVMWTLPLHLILLEIRPEWRSACWVAVGAGFLGYAAVTRRAETAIASVVIVSCASLYVLLEQSIWHEVPWSVIGLAFAAPAAMWLVYDRVAERFMEHAPTRRASAMAVPIAAVLLTVLPLRIETLAAQYLTVSWSVLGVALFVWAIITRTTLHRYVSLAVMALAVGRVILIDTADLEALYRVGAFMAVGLALLGLGLVYIKVFGVGDNSQSEAEIEAPTVHEPEEDA